MPSWAVLKKTMNSAVIVDGRNIYDRKELNGLDFVYACIGQ